MGKQFDYNCRFLVVDDFLPMSKTICSNLAKMGFKHTYAAADGRDAISHLKAHKVDCIISDWHMPKVSGLDLLRYVRSTEELRHIPFMMVTSESDRKMVNTAIAEGVSDFLIKPFTPKMLTHKLELMLLENSSSLQLINAINPTEDPHAEPSLANTIDSPPSVLVVDDSPDVIHLISEAVGDLYRLNAVTSGEKALKFVRKNLPDLVMLDIMMPGMDGMEVCKELKSDTRTSEIPIIFITSKTEGEDIAAGYKAGAVDYVTKPMHPEVLRERVKTHVALKRSRDEMRHQIQTLMDNAKLREDIERMTRHDLKAPLSAIINITEELYESKWVGADHKPQIETMRSATTDMIQMINRSLDLYKMETGTYRMQNNRVNLVKVLRKVVVEARAYAKPEKIIVEYHAPEECFIKGEDLLCFSLFSNLIRNAIEAQSKGDTVTVRLLDEGNQVIVLIHNDALIPEGIQDNSFDKYVTADKRNGTGLGTYSAKLITETLGGTIDFSSFPTEGTEFRVALLTYKEDE